MKLHSEIQCCVKTPGLVLVEQQEPHCIEQDPGKTLLWGLELPSWRKLSCKSQRSHPEGETLLQAPELLFQERDAGPELTRAAWQPGGPGHNVSPLHLCSCVSHAPGASVPCPPSYDVGVLQLESSRIKPHLFSVAELCEIWFRLWHKAGKLIGY